MTRSSLFALVAVGGLTSVSTCFGDDIQTQATAIIVGNGGDTPQQIAIIEGRTFNADFPVYGSAELPKAATKKPIAIDVQAFWDDSAPDNLNPKRYPVTVVQASIAQGLHGTSKSEPLVLEVTPVTGSKLKWQTTIPAGALKSNQIYYLELSAHKGNLETPTYRLKLLVP